MRRVCIESPYAGDVAANIAYAKRAVCDCLKRGEAPIASHLFFTQPGILDDSVPAERDKGIEAGLAWQRVADAIVVYIDRGISPGMELAIDRALFYGLTVEYRSIGDAT